MKEERHQNQTDKKLSGHIMSEKVPHELEAWVRQADQQMLSDYQAIRQRSKADPGSAGARGEEGWRQLLEKWLPAKYHVVSGGQILTEDGEISPQIDVLVLHPSYPKGLVGNRLYIAEAVAAAFECKITLRRRDLLKTVRNSVAIARMLKPRFGSPRGELVRPIIYGLLAQSHEFPGDREQAMDAVLSEHLDIEEAEVKHPRESLDLICLSDLATFATDKMAWNESEQPPGCDVSYMCYGRDRWSPAPSAIGTFIYVLYGKMGMRDPDLRPLYNYFGNVVATQCYGRKRHWGGAPFSPSTLSALPANLVHVPWQEWSLYMR